MIIANSKPLMIIGYAESSLTQECYNFLSPNFNNNTKIITPEEFISIKNKKEFQYINAFSLDRPLRKKICDKLDELDLDCVTYIDDTCVVSPSAKIGKGVFIGPFCTVCLNANIQNFCSISTYCLISHYTFIGKNSLLHSAVKIAGKTTVGKDCVFNFNSSAINDIKITDNVIVGANSNITKDVVESGYYVGTIARRYYEKRRSTF